MRERIWSELWQVKFSHCYCSMTLDWYRKRSNTFAIITTLFSSTGVIMGLGFWKQGTIFPLISCLIITIIQVIKSLLPRIIPSEKQFRKIEQVVTFYLKQYNDFEKFWYEYEAGKHDDTQAREKFYKFKEKEEDIMTTIDEVINHNSNKIKIKASTETNLYKKNNNF